MTKSCSPSCNYHCLYPSLYHIAPCIICHSWYPITCTQRIPFSLKLFTPSTYTPIHLSPIATTQTFQPFPSHKTCSMNIPCTFVTYLGLSACTSSFSLVQLYLSRFHVSSSLISILHTSHTSWLAIPIHPFARSPVTKVLSFLVQLARRITHPKSTSLGALR